MKKKLVVFSDTYLKNSETFIYSQLKGLESDFDITFVAPHLTNLQKFPFSKTVEVKRSLWQRFVRVFNPFRLHKSDAARLEHALKKIDPDVIHVHFGTNAMRIAPVVRKLNVPMLITFHGSDASKRLTNARYSALLKKELPHVDFICVSKALETNLEDIGITINQNHVLYIGVDVKKFPYQERMSMREKVASEQPIIFVQVSRFVEKKGHEYTCEAFKQFLAKVDKPELFRLHFIGSGPLENQIREFVKQEGMEEHVRFLGTLSHPEVITSLHTSDALVQHSVTSKAGDTEGLPIGIMEAMATGLPVISTYHSGIPELITDGANGYLVEERDVEAYRDKMLALVNEEIDFRNQGRKTIEERFNLEKQTAELSRRLSGLAESRSR